MRIPNYSAYTYYQASRNKVFSSSNTTFATYSDRWTAPVITVTFGLITRLTKLLLYKNKTLA